MARVAQYVIGAFEEDDYDHNLYDKVDKVIAKIDSNPKAKGFIGPQIPAYLIRMLNKKGIKKYAFSGFLWFKGYYKKNPHIAYQIWCRELYNARFSKKEINEIYRVSSLPGNDNGYDEIGSKAWRMLLYR